MPMSRVRSVVGRVSAVTLLTLGALAPCWSVAAEVTTPFGVLGGDLSLMASLQAPSGGASQNLVIPLTGGTVTTTGGAWAFDAPLALTDSYGGASQHYIASGSLSLAGLPALTPIPGVALGDVMITVVGSYANTGVGYVYFNGASSEPLYGSGTFSITRSLAEIQAQAYGSRSIVRWYGSYEPSYASGSFAPSSVQVSLSGIRVSQSVTVVPEPTSMALMALGLVGVAAVVRRRAG